MFPYKLLVVQQQKDSYYTGRTKFANWRLHNIQADALFLNQQVCSEECVLHADGKVNMLTVRIWGTENPQINGKWLVIVKKLLYGVPC